MARLLPRQGHLEQAIRVFAYLSNKHNTELVFDPTIPSIDDVLFPRQNWDHTPFSESIERIPSNAPQPRGYGFYITAYVDSDHAGDMLTRHSRTSFLVYVNNAPIFWSSKKQGGIETSSFASEFMVMKSCCEYLRGLRYKLRMMGIAINGPSYIYGDNKSVLSNASLPDSVLRKKSVSIAYNFV